MKGYEEKWWLGMEVMNKWPSDMSFPSVNCDKHVLHMALYNYLTLIKHMILGFPSPFFLCLG